MSLAYPILISIMMFDVSLDYPIFEFIIRVILLIWIFDLTLTEPFSVYQSVHMSVYEIGEIIECFWNLWATSLSSFPLISSSNHFLSWLTLHFQIDTTEVPIFYLNNYFIRSLSSIFSRIIRFFDRSEKVIATFLTRKNHYYFDYLLEL